MRCHYYQDSPVVRCCAFLHGLKLPTRAEREKFCLHGALCVKCPTYIKKEKDLQKVG